MEEKPKRKKTGGRQLMPDEEKKQPIGLRLAPDVVEIIKSKPKGDRTEFVEKAVRAQHRRDTRTRKP